MKSRKDKIEFVSLKKFIQHLTALQRDRDYPLLIALTYNPEQKVIKINLLPSEFYEFIDARPRINRKTKHRVKPVLVKRSRLKRK